MEWISVKNNLPPFNTDCLVVDHLNDQWVAIRKFYDTREWWEIKLDNEDCCFCVCPQFGDEPDERKITHWMPLPRTPG